MTVSSPPKPPLMETDIVSADTLSPLDLDAYLERIDYAGPRLKTRQALEGLHLAHVTHVPFENLDILLSRPIRLDLDSLQAKLVRDRRGGYCFEQNALFAAALEEMGFAVTRLAARVRFGASRLLPRTHMLLRVDVDGEPFLADVGFGGAGLLHPIPLRAGHAVRQFAWSYRLAEDSGLWILQSLNGGNWADLYTFTLEPQFPVDYEMANWFTSTHPDSVFTRLLLVQLSMPDARYHLNNRVLSVERGGQVETCTMEDDEALRGVLAETFGLVFSPGTRFRYREDPR
jgi:N-hydroxyarylamine O-acetyltransferase